MKTLIFFIILWQISAALKKVFEISTQKDRQKIDEKGKRPGWQKKLIEVATKIKEEIDAQNTRTSSSSSSSWDYITTADGRKGKPSAEKGKALGDSKFSKRTPIKKTVSDKDPQVLKEKTAIQPIESSSYGQTEKKPDAVLKNHRVLKKECSSVKDSPVPYKSRYKLKGLKKAVIWKEILAKPVGLRRDKD